jgi:hypothetical protein
MCLSPDMCCCWCLMESYGQLLRYPVEEIEEGFRLCSQHKQEYLENSRVMKFSIEGRNSIAALR